MKRNKRYVGSRKKRKMSEKRCPVGGVDRDGKVDRISIQNAVETPFWMAVWATEPERLIDVRMSYSDLKIICDLIDSERKKRQVNRMSDDLISRKAFMEYLGLGDTEENREENIGEIVTLEDFDRQPTAFDKEKVIEELEDYLFEKYCVEGDEKIAETVEKGGIE